MFYVYKLSHHFLGHQWRFLLYFLNFFFCSVFRITNINKEITAVTKVWSIKTNISVRYQINLCVNPFVMWNNWDLYSNCNHIILVKITFHESKQFILVFHLMFFHSHFSFFSPKTDLSKHFLPYKPMLH